MSKKYNGMVADLWQDFKLSGRATHAPRPKTEWEQKYDKAKEKLDLEFAGKHPRREHIDKATVVVRYHRIWLDHRFPFGLPHGFITPEKVVKFIAK